MVAIRRYSNPYTPRGRRRGRQGLSNLRRKAERQIKNVTQGLKSDIMDYLDTVGIKYYFRKRPEEVFHTMTNTKWRKLLIKNFYDEEELMNLPPAETGLNANAILVLSCDREVDDICAILTDKPTTTWFNELAKQAGWVGHEKRKKLKIAAETLRKEVLKRISQWGFTVGEPLMFEHYTSTGTPLTLFPLYSKNDLRII